MTPPMLLIDGDILIYRAALGAETPINWGNDLWTLHARLEDAIDIFDRAVDNICGEFGVGTGIICLSDTKSNFRKDILPTYKANRKGKRPPLLRGPLREYVQANYWGDCKEGLEADDVMSIWATSEYTNHVIATVDKDLLSVPGKYYNIDTGVLQEVSELEADFNFMLQALTGDATDGYSGCPGIGKVRAKRLLEDTPEDEWWDAVVKCYEKAGLNEEYALRQARMARILRRSDYNFKKMCPKLWTPKKR